MKKLFISIFTCVFALFALGTSTFAWFSMSKEANVKGMNFKVEIDSDLLIGNYSLVATAGVAQAEDADYKTAISASDSSIAELNHSSSVDGMNFFKVVASVDGLGAVVTPEAGENKYAPITSSTGYYVQHDFMVKYYNPTDTAQTVDLTELKVKYTEDSENPDSDLANEELANAVRIAVLTTEYTYVEGAAAANVQTHEVTIDGETQTVAVDPICKGVYKLSGATYFTDNSAVNGVNSLGTVTAIAEHVYSCPANCTTFFEISIVIWLEGEDTTCMNKVYTALKGSWEISFQLSKTGEEGKTKVSAITRD